MTAAMERTDEQQRRAIAEFVRDRAAALDRGETDTRIDLARIGESGLLTGGLDGGELRDMVAVIEDVAAESLAVGFSLWAQRMALEYIDRAPATLRGKFRDDLGAGRRVGVTAMAAAMKHLAGLGDLTLAAERTDDGLVVSGPIHWASNVFDDALIVFPARTADGSGVVAAVRADSPGIRIDPRPDLLALGATASTSLTFDRVHVPHDQIVTDELRSFCGAVRPTFLLLQTSFCVGISRTALDESCSRTTGLGALFVDEYHALRDRFDNLRDRLYEYAGAPASVAPADLLRLRLDGSFVAVEATRLESTLRGGAGYASASATNRRFREAAFLPIQSPSEGQLRWELSQYE
ncbi:acyl-CoA dehydrogenase family protein [Rhodococcus sp. NPDC003382]|uniref:acyl-CoA dehydrogenase family protein n=1 Tax=unclassified Rhodococcus (in: high G+C Gram-positive bacteria) TaxID=192944 RepID=UPI0018CF1800|nr:MULTISPECIES: acyl-CoA dehydrogenase family protein [unclassified Rhodococcus (in: high G+C Gram-positive bacteria)]MBH0118913.1 acyl-CoA/acyl-ACP dehydrogenase [Rhodococcus sp. CX]MCK8673118.1 acyl-CoA/acyl-ACP dehydrogenase [Rhodococcus sp. HM1]